MQYFEFIDDFLEMDLLFKRFCNVYGLPLNALPTTPPSMDAVRRKTKLLLVWLLFYWTDTSAVKDLSFSCTESCEMLTYAKCIGDMSVFWDDGMIYLLFKALLFSLFYIKKTVAQIELGL